MPRGRIIAGPAWLSPPDRMPGVEPEKQITAATIATPPTMPAAAATRLSPLGRCPCGDFGARPPTTRHILCRVRRDFVNDDALLSAGPGLPP